MLYILTGYQVLGIVYHNQLSGAHHTHTSNQDKFHKFDDLEKIPSFNE